MIEEEKESPSPSPFPSYPNLSNKKNSKLLLKILPINSKPTSLVSVHSELADVAVDRDSFGEIDDEDEIKWSAFDARNNS